MADDGTVQPWENADLLLDPAKKRMLGLMALPPQPLAQMQPPSQLSPSPGQVPLASSNGGPKLGIAPPQPKPLADTVDTPSPAPKLPSQQYADWMNTQPKREDYPVSTGRKILGVLAAGATGSAPLYRAIADPYSRAESQWEKQGARIKTEADIQKEERLPATKAAPEPRTVETGDGVYQYNEDTGRYDIKVGPPKSVNKPDTQTQNKERFQSVIAKVDAAKLPTDPASLPKSLNSALQQGKITPEEHQQASGYLAANPTPSTTVQVQTTAAQTKEQIKEQNDYYRWTDPQSGRIMTGQGKPQGAAAEPIGDAKAYAQHKREANAANIVQQSLNRVAQDIDEHPEIFDSGPVRAVLATALDDNQAQSIGLLIAGTGGNIKMPGGSGKIIDTLLENNAVPQEMRRAVKDYIADYWALRDKAVVQQMEMQGGKIGRGSQQVFQSIIAQIPAGGTADSTMARRQIGNLQQTQDQLNRQYADDGKEKPYQMKGGAAGAPTAIPKGYAIKVGNDIYTYKGAGDTKDLKNWDKQGKP